MSAYLKFFALEKSPFDTSAQSNLVLGTRALRSAFSEIEAGLAEGAPRICMSGGVGMGKTSLARALPKLLVERARVVLLLNPSLSWRTLRNAIVKQLDLEGGVLSRRSLLAAATGSRKLVLVIDQAEQISQESLEHLDILLAYRGDADQQLLHCILLANLEQAGRDGGDCPLLWWLDSLNTLQLEFAPIPASGVASYVEKHLKRAGWKGERLFTDAAAIAIHQLTGGVPRAISQQCERILAEAAERGLRMIDAVDVEAILGPVVPAPTTSAAASTTTARRSAPSAASPSGSATRSAETTLPDGAALATTAAADSAQPPRVGSPIFQPVEAPLSLDSYFASADGDFSSVPRQRARRGVRLLVTAIGVAALLAGGLALLMRDGDDSAARAPALGQAPARVEPPTLPRPAQPASAPAQPPILARAKGPVLPDVPRANSAPADATPVRADPGPAAAHASPAAAHGEAATPSIAPRLVESVAAPTAGPAAPATPERPVAPDAR